MVLLGSWLAINVSAQEHPYIGYYSLTELDGGVRVDWTIQGGSTCDGQEVERAIDGSDFEPVHRIEGICGDPAFSVPFFWFDTGVPEFSSVQYRIRLGAQGYSSVKTIAFDQLTHSAQRFFPSPMAEEATLLINVPASAPVDLRIWDLTGKLVMEDPSAVGQMHTIRLVNAPSGMYLYRATSEGRVFQGRFMKQ
jgi:hypothetical protein